MIRKILILAVALTALAAQAADEAGTVKVTKGSVMIERGSEKIAAKPGMKVLVGDRVVTGADSSAGLTLRDNTLLSAGANSTLSLDKFSFNPTTHEGALDAALRRGTLAVVSGKIAKASPQAVQFRTPTAILGVRGTEFVIEAGAGEN
ncbi:MAG: hypothetical protein H6R18_2567 [Proteobacteria bacterium]|nr:hypothetical protein [Pseudomonadota bacterium]